MNRKSKMSLDDLLKVVKHFNSHKKWFKIEVHNRHDSYAFNCRLIVTEGVLTGLQQDLLIYANYGWGLGRNRETTPYDVYEKAWFTWLNVLDH